jgi:hypothetical protein
MPRARQADDLLTSSGGSCSMSSTASGRTTCCRWTDEGIASAGTASVIPDRVQAKSDLFEDMVDRVRTPSPSCLQDRSPANDCAQAAPRQVVAPRPSPRPSSGVTLSRGRRSGNRYPARAEGRPQRSLPRGSGKKYKKVFPRGPEGASARRLSPRGRPMARGEVPSIKM